MVKVEANVHSLLKHMPSNSSSIWVPLMKAHGWRFAFGCAIALVHYSIQFLQPVILKLLIRHVDSAEEETWKGFVYTAAMFTVSVVYSLTFHHYLQHITIISLQMRTSLLSVVYRKSLRLSNEARRKYTGWSLFRQ